MQLQTNIVLSWIKHIVRDTGGIIFAVVVSSVYFTILVLLQMHPKKIESLVKSNSTKLDVTISINST